MSNPRKELSDLQSALLGFAEGIQGILNRTNASLKDQVSQLVYYNKQLQDTLSQQQMLQTKPAADDIALMKKMAESLEGTLSALNKENQKFTKGARAEKLNGLKQDVDQVVTRIRKPGS